MSWIATFLVLLGMWMTGEKMPKGWAVSFAGSTCWFYVAVDTAQPALMVVNFVFMLLAARNFARWRE